MPTQSTKLKLPIPLGNEFHNRAAMVNLINEIDSKAGAPGGLALLDDSGKVIGVPDVKDASTTQKGIVQLDDTTDSTSTTKAATANAVNKVKQLISNVANYAIATAAEAKAGVVNNKYMTPLRTKEAIADLAPKPIVLSAGPTLITDNISVPGTSLANGVTSGDVIRWNATVGGVARVFWKVSSGSSSDTEFVHTWIEVNGTRQGEERVMSTRLIQNTLLTQDVTISPGDKIAIRYRHTATLARVLGLTEAYIGAIMNKFSREV